MENDCSNKKEEYFEIYCTLPTRLAELWSWFCFEKGALGILTEEESIKESRFKVFFEKRPLGGAKKLVNNFQNEISKEKNIIILYENVRVKKNWQINWRDNFSSVKVGKRIIVLPAWEKGKKLNNRYPVLIDPGLAFGTGHHISTVLALEKLEKYILSLKTFPDKMLDIGMGSGILSIAACRLGLKNVQGVDIDENALKEVKKNVVLNGMKGRIEIIIGQPSSINEPASLVICNMLLNDILSIKTELSRLTSHNGTLICSGMLKGQEIELIDSLNKIGFKGCTVIEKQKWCAVDFKRI